MQELKFLLLPILFPSFLFGQSSIETDVRIKSKFNRDWKFILDDKSGFDPAILSLQA